MPSLSRRFLSLLSGAVLSCIPVLGFVASARALPPASDIPEEVLRSQFWIEQQDGQIILERSPVDGQVLQLPDVVAKQQQADRVDPPERELSPTIQNLVMLLRLRHLLKSLLPF